MRKVITPKSELESNHNKKTTLASFKHLGDSREEYNGRNVYITLENNNSKKNTDSKVYNSIINKSKNSPNKSKDYKQCDESVENEEPIIFSKKKGHLDTISNDDVVCCTSACYIF